MHPKTEMKTSTLQFSEALLGLYFATTGICARLSTLASITGASGTATHLQNLTKHFGSCVMWGYEQTVVRFIWEKSKDTNSKWYQSLPRLSDPNILGTGFAAATTMLQGLASGAEDTLLNQAQKNTMKSLLSFSAHKERIVEAFNQSLVEQEKKVVVADQLLTNAVLSGSDFTDIPNKNVAAFSRRLHGLSKEDAPYFNTIYSTLDRTSAVFSALASAWLVEMDFIGRVMGSELAMLTIHYYPHMSESLSSTVLPGILTFTFIYNELNEFLYDYCWKFDKKIGLDTIFYPLVSGIMNSMHEEFKTVDPKIDTVNSSLKKIAEDSIQNNRIADKNIVVEKLLLLKTLPKDIAATWTASWSAAKKYYAKYDKDIADIGLEKALQKNPTASKRLLSCRKSFLQVMNNCQNKQYLHNMMNIILHFRPAILTLQLFASKAIFTTSKHTTDVITKTTGFLKNLAQNLHQKPVVPIDQDNIEKELTITTKKSSH